MFGMGTGVTLSSLPPEIVNLFASCTLTTAQHFSIQAWPFQLVSFDLALNQALDLLVSSSCMRYRTSTDDLSTW